MPELPPLTAELKGKIDRFMADMEVVKAAIRSLRDEARREILLKIATRYEEGKNIAGTGNADMRKIFRDLVKEAERAGRDSGISYRRAFNDEFAKIRKDQKGWPGWLPLVGAGLPLAAPLLTGLAGIVGGTATAAAGGAAGLGALFLSLKDALGPVTAAFSSIDTASTAGVPANATALQIWLRSSRKNSLGKGLGFLTNANANWYSLTPAQQKALVLASQDTKGMPNSEVAQIRALMGERQAYLPLDAGQRKALFQYTNFDQAYSNATGASEPAALRVFGAGLGAVTPVLKFLPGLANTAAKALMPLISEIGKGFSSKGFSTFVGWLEKMATVGIKGFGQSLINVGIGLGHLFEGFAKSGLASKMMDSLVRVTQHFATWSGGKGFQTFMSYVKANTPTVTKLLGGLGKIIGGLVKSLGGTLGHLELQGLAMLSQLLGKIVNIPGIGPFLANMIALQLVLSKTFVVAGEVAAFKALWTWFKELEIVTKVTGWFSTFFTTISTKGLAALKSMATSMLNGVKTAGIWAGEMIVKMATAVAAWVAGLLGIDAATASSTAFIIATSGGIILLLAGLAIGIYELYKHWNTVWGWIKRIAADAWHFMWDGWGKYLLAVLGPTGLIILGLVLLSQHWRQIWDEIKRLAADAWHFMWDGWGKYLLAVLGPTGLIILGLVLLSQHWKQIWGEIKDVAKDFWHYLSADFGDKIGNFFTETVPRWFDDSVTFIGKFWNGLKTVVAGPVKWVINNVIDGIINAFDWVTQHIGLGRPIKPIYPLGHAAGGRLPGFGGGDVVPALLEPGEAIVDKYRTKRYASLLGMMGVPGFAAGGVAGGGGGGGILSKGLDIIKILAALTTGNSTALTNAFTALIGAKPPSTGGVLGSIFTAMPRALVGDAVHWLFGHARTAAGAFSGLGPGPGHTTIPGNAVTWIMDVLQTLNYPKNWLTAMEVLVSKESGGNSSAYDPISVFGEHAEGIAQLLPSTFAIYGLGGSIWNPISNLIASMRYIKSKYGSPYNIPNLFAGHYLGYSRGGIIPEPVLGLGLGSGRLYSFAENGPETVIPATRPGAPGPGRDAGGNVYITVLTNEINPRYHSAQLGFELARRSG